MSAGDLAQRIDAVQTALDEDALVELAMELANVPSPVGHAGPFAQHFCDRMRDAGLAARVHPFPPDQSNALGVLEGTGGGRRLMFNATMETDFFPDAASVPPARIVDGDWLAGFGIWNMKGALAAALAAAAAVRKAGVELPGDVLIAGVAGMIDQAPVATRIAGEQFQGYGVGTKHLLAQGGHADLCVVGTPTSFKLVTKHFGTTGVRIDVRVKPYLTGPIEDVTGDPAGFMAPAGANAVEQAAEIVQALRAWIPDYQRRNTVDGVPPWIRIAGIEAGMPWLPVPAAEGSVFVFVGTPPHAPTTAVLDDVRSLLAAVRERTPDVEARAELYAVNPGPSVPDDHPLVTALRASHAGVFGSEPEEPLVVWHSDSSPLAVHGIPSVNYGPAGRLTPEREDEAVRIPDLVRCARVYADLIVRVCGEPVAA